jgi:RNA polymerase sigma factor (sigma-70 family)
MREALRRREPLPAFEMDALALRAQHDPGARERLVVECMGLIANTARRCRNTLGEDAFGEASVALLEAVDSFEPEQGDFRTWAVYQMWCRLSDKARGEKRFRARILRGEEVLPASDPTPLPELLVTAVRDRAVTGRQAQIVQMKTTGSTRAEVMERFALQKSTYYEELQRAMKALRSYL